MDPLSFEPAAEATYRRSVFSQFPAKLLGEQSWDICKNVFIFLVFNSSFFFCIEDKPTEVESTEDVNTSLDIRR